MMHLLGGKVEVAPVREYGKIEVTVDTSSALFENVSEKTICWMSHNDYISKAAGSSRCKRREKSLCNPVPSGGSSYQRRKEDAFQLCI